MILVVALGMALVLVIVWLDRGEPEPPVCPECRNGKHLNCTDWAIDSDDEVVECACSGAGHGPRPVD